MDPTTSTRGVTWQSGVIAGLALAVLWSASPLVTLALAGSAALLAAAGRGLDPREQRLLLVVVGGALAARFLFIGALLIGDIPVLNDLSVGGLRGDDAYYLGRAIRARDVALGVTQGRYDFFVITDEYARTSYLQLLTILQVLFGPTPYGMRAINGLLFVAGAVVLFRLVRPGFGASASFGGLLVLLFLPSLFVSSVSLLKESIYFLASALLLRATVTILRRSSIRAVIGGMALAALCLLLLEDMRRGALQLALAAVAMGLTLPVIFATRRRAIASMASMAVVITVAMAQPPVRARAVDAVTAAAKTHAGHVFTKGHAYKLLDEGFYSIPGTPASWPLKLSDGQALRFVVRAAASFLVTPLPWEMVSLSELMFFPEHALWLVMIVFAPIGVFAAWPRDSRVTALLAGWIVPTAAALAVTTGNVGTLLRLRGLVTPYLVWFAVLGVLSAAAWAAQSRPAPFGLTEQGR